MSTHPKKTKPPQQKTLRGFSFLEAWRGPTPLFGCDLAHVVGHRCVKPTPKHKKIPQLSELRDVGLKPGDELLSHGDTPHYHRRCIVSLLSSGWGQVVPMLYGRQANWLERRAHNRGSLLDSPGYIGAFSKLSPQHALSNKVRSIKLICGSSSCITSLDSITTSNCLPISHSRGK